MPRAKKDGRYINCYVKKDIADRVDAYSEASLISKTAILEMALQEYLDKVQKVERAV